MYHALNSILLRASAQSADVDFPPWPDLTRDLRADSIRAWLSEMWSQELLADAITVASPDLSVQVERICAGEILGPRQLRRTVTAVSRYQLRMAGRCTPFGLFAGIAPVTVGTTAAVRWGCLHRAVMRPDGEWLAAVIGDLEACQPLLRRLAIRLSDLTEVRDGQVTLQHRPRLEGHQSRDASATIDVSVRLTPAVAAVIALTRESIEFADLGDELARQFPGAALSAVEDAISALVRLRILLTTLRPSMTTTETLAHLLDQLTASRAGEIPEVAETVRELRVIAARMEAQRTSPSGDSRRRFRAISTSMNRLHNTGRQPVSIDLQLNAEIVLPESLTREAAAAARALTRLTPYPTGLPAWRDYHAAFLERYGTDAVVPLLDLVDPAIGLGYPATYRSSERSVTATALSERDRRLLRLAQQSTMGGGDELLIDDRVLDELAGPEHASSQVPPHIELFLQIEAESVIALRQDRFTLAVTGASRAAGTTTGRFLYLLEPRQQELYREAFAQVATMRAGAVPAQVSAPPIHDFSNHLANAPRMLPTVLSFGEFDAEGDVVQIGDLAVSGDLDGLFLISLRDRRLIEPTVLSAVEFRYFSHPLTRLICELPRSCAAVYMPFSWGAAASQPFLPRVRYRRTILARARWNLAAAGFPPASEPWPQWSEALAAWRRRFRMPARTYLAEADNLLPLDLGNDRHQYLLRTHLGRHGHARLEEAPRPEAFGWLNGHVHEIAVPLTSTRPPRPDRLPARVRPVSCDDAHLPGSANWLYAKLYTSKGRVVSLASQFAEQESQGPDPGAWWYLPYSDPGPHLRLRVPLRSPEDYGSAAARIARWARQLRANGLISHLQLATYRPENGRYGHGEAMAMAERVFAADSAAALAELHAASDCAIPLEAMTAASLVNMTAEFTGDIFTAMTWIADNLPKEIVPSDRSARAAAVRLADPAADWSALRYAEMTGAVLVAWRERRRALMAYRDQLGMQRDPDSVLSSLLHLHSIRVHGVDPQRERAIRGLARASALRWLALHAASSQ